MSEMENEETSSEPKEEVNLLDNSTQNYKRELIQRKSSPRHPATCVLNSNVDIKEVEYEQLRIETEVTPSTDVIESVDAINENISIKPSVGMTKNKFSAMSELSNVLVGFGMKPNLRKVNAGPTNTPNNQFPKADVVQSSPAFTLNKSATKLPTVEANSSPFGFNLKKTGVNLSKDSPSITESTQSSDLGKSAPNLIPKTKPSISNLTPASDTTRPNSDLDKVIKPLSKRPIPVVPPIAIPAKNASTSSSDINKGVTPFSGRTKPVFPPLDSAKTSSISTPSLNKAPSNLFEKKEPIKPSFIPTTQISATAPIFKNRISSPFLDKNKVIMPVFSRVSNLSSSNSDSQIPATSSPAESSLIMPNFPKVTDISISNSDKVSSYMEPEITSATPSVLENKEAYVPTLDSIHVSTSTLIKNQSDTPILSSISDMPTVGSALPVIEKSNQNNTPYNTPIANTQTLLNVSIPTYISTPSSDKVPSSLAAKTKSIIPSIVEEKEDLIPILDSNSASPYVLIKNQSDAPIISSISDVPTVGSALPDIAKTTLNDTPDSTAIASTQTYNNFSPATYISIPNSDKVHSSLATETISITASSVKIKDGSIHKPDSKDASTSALIQNKSGVANVASTSISPSLTSGIPVIEQKTATNTSIYAPTSNIPKPNVVLRKPIPPKIEKKFPALLIPDNTNEQTKNRSVSMTAYQKNNETPIDSAQNVRLNKESNDDMDIKKNQAKPIPTIKNNRFILKNSTSVGKPFNDTTLNNFQDNIKKDNSSVVASSSFSLNVVKLKPIAENPPPNKLPQKSTKVTDSNVGKFNVLVNKFNAESKCPTSPTKSNSNASGESSQQISKDTSPTKKGGFWLNQVDPKRTSTNGITVKKTQISEVPSPMPKHYGSIAEETTTASTLNITESCKNERASDSIPPKEAESYGKQSYGLKQVEYNRDQNKSVSETPSFMMEFLNKRKQKNVGAN